MENTKKTSRGLRNNNPGNIRHSTVRYLGEIEGTDTAFKTFGDMCWGYRAMFVVLHTYRTKHGIDTLCDMISRYAPAFENHTEAYARFVAEMAGIEVGDRVDTQSKELMTAIVGAMSRIENGVAADVDDVRRGWELFVNHKP